MKNLKPCSDICLLFQPSIKTVLHFHNLGFYNHLSPKLNLHLLQLFSLPSQTMNSLLQNPIINPHNSIHLYRTEVLPIKGVLSFLHLNQKPTLNHSSHKNPERNSFQHTNKVPRIWFVHQNALASTSLTPIDETNDPDDKKTLAFPQTNPNSKINK